MSENQYGTILTNRGLEIITNAAMNNIKIGITHLAVGDGSGQYYEPTPDMMSLKNETWRGLISSININQESHNMIDIVGVIPSDVGGFTIREMAIFDDLGNMIAICNTPDTQKVSISSGSIGEIELVMKIALENTQSILFDVNPLALATVEQLNAIPQKSWYADFEAYYGNTKLVSDFHTTEGIAGNVTLDTVNALINAKSVKLKPSSDNEGVVNITQTFNTKDLSKLNNGQMFENNDYVYLSFYISSMDLIKDGTNLYVDFRDVNNAQLAYAMLKNNLNQGWNYIKAKKSEFNGSGDFTQIKSANFWFSHNAGQANEFISFQLLQLIKNDPLEDYPNPFQKNGKRELAINAGEWFVGYEYGKLVCKSLTKGVNLLESLILNKSFKNFVMTGEKQIETNSPHHLFGWKTNTFLVRTYVGNNNLTIIRINNGVVDVVTIPNIVLTKGDIVKSVITKKDNNFEIKTYRNNELVNDFKFNHNCEDDDGQMFMSTFIDKYLLSMSITELTHAHHANVADVAKSLEEQTHCFVYSSLNQSIANSVQTPIVFDSIYYDNHDLVDGIDKLKIKETGVYLIEFYANWEGSANGNRVIQLIANNNNIYVLKEKSISNQHISSFTSFHRLNRGDDLRIKVYQDSGSSLILYNWAKLKVQKIG